MRAACPLALLLLGTAGCTDRSLEVLADKPTTDFTIDATTSPLVVQASNGMVTLRVTNNTGKAVQMGGTCDYVEYTRWYLLDSWGQPVTRTADGWKYLTEDRPIACTANAMLVVPAHGTATINAWVLKTDFHLTPGDYTLRMTYNTPRLHIASYPVPIKVVE